MRARTKRVFFGFFAAPSCRQGGVTSVQVSGTEMQWQNRLERTAALIRHRVPEEDNVLSALDAVTTNDRDACVDDDV
jgi:hypothetical protein